MTERRSYLRRFLIKYRRAVIVGLHVLLVPAAFVLAFLLRFDGPIPAPELRKMLVTLPALVVIRLACFARYELFRGWWRHVGMFDLQSLLKATTLGSLLFTAFLFAIQQLPGFPRSVLFLEWGLSLALLGGVRFGVRWLRERTPRVRRQLGKRALIIGAGDAGAQLLRLLQQEKETAIRPIGFVDDARTKRGIQVHGVPVLGRTADIERLVQTHRIEMLILAIATATREERRRIAEKCAGLNVELKVVPALLELIDGRARLTQLRSVVPEDLLGRSPVSLDLKPVETDLHDGVILITGGAGSIGSELARQIADLGPRRLIILDQAESPLYFLDLELRQKHPRLDVCPIVGDVTHLARVEDVFARHRPDYVFHAAAYKHVPMMEANPVEAVRNNVHGTLRVAECAVRYGARKFVLISTDKAVRPSSIMGATKRIAERVVLAMPQLWRNDMDVRCVRFGNVLDSAGSVIPLFRRQIARGGPVTVTHAEATRYFMTIPEAVQLVLQAAAVPEAAGRVSMLEMGEPVRILEMAENLIRLLGLQPYTEVPIVFIGLRAGEKLHEELTTDLEAAVPTTVKQVRVVQETVPHGPTIQAGVAMLESAVEANDEDQLMLGLCRLVPECVSPLKELGHEASARRSVRPSRLASLSEAPVSAAPTVRGDLGRRPTPVRARGSTTGSSSEDGSAR